MRILLLLVAAGTIGAQKNSPDEDLKNIMSRYDWHNISGESVPKDTAAVKVALQAGANPSGRIRGNPYLALAATHCLKDMAYALVEKGADVNAATYGGWTALMGASDNRCEEIVKLLIAKKADVNAKTRQGRSVLMRAAYHGYYPTIVRLLIKAGANVNDADKAGNTALIFAAQQGYLETVQTLLDAGADKKLKNKDGKDALAFARAIPSVDPYGEALDASTKANIKKIIALLEGKAENKTGPRIGKVFSADGNKLEITGEGIAKLAKGQKLVIQNSEGLINATVTETLHSKVKAKTAGKGTARKGDAVHLAH